MDGGTRLHPGITQEVAPNESQRAPNVLTGEALIFDVFFVVRGPWCPVGKGSQPKGRWFKSSPRYRLTKSTWKARVFDFGDCRPPQPSTTSG